VTTVELPKLPIFPASRDRFSISIGNRQSAIGKTKAVTSEERPVTGDPNYQLSIVRFRFQSAIDNQQSAIEGSPLVTRHSSLCEGGIALLAVMWAVAVMLLVALAFSSSVQVETRAASYRKEALQAHALACGGVDAALWGIAYPPRPDQPPSSLWTWLKGQREWSVPFPRGGAEVEIVNETGKLDLNSAGRQQFRRLFEARGLEAAAANQLAAAIIHWRSPAGADDQETRALEDYYKQKGYRPAHAPFASVEEALRLRGMTSEVFCGTVEVTGQGALRRRYGVGRDLTVFSGSAQVNVNYASEAVLLSVPEMGPATAQALIRERSKKPFGSIIEISERVASPLADESLPFLTTADSKTYSIVSIGRVAGSPVRRAVRAVVQLAPQGASPYRTIAWYDDDSSE
jgi:general secretion pathway protein K